MTSAVSICSAALIMLGDKPIARFDEDSDRALQASNLYEPVRDFVMASHPWNSCSARVELAPDATGPAFDWSYQYTLPADFLQARSIGESGAEGEFKIEGRKLLCNDNPLLLRYTFKNDNPGTYDQLLVWALTLAMKAVFAYPTTQSTSLEELVTRELSGVLKRARASDGQGDTPDQLGDSPLLAARFARWRG